MSVSIEEYNYLQEENIKLKLRITELEEHLKKYTAPERSKKYYENHKEELLSKMKENPIPSDKRKEYNKRYYLKKKESEQKINV